MVDDEQQLTLAMMVVLETLQPVERAVYLLREICDFAHLDIAEMLGETPAQVRQQYRRARLKIADAAPPRHPNEQDMRLFVEAFLNAAVAGDKQKVMALLSDDVVALSDGGGKASAAIIPLRGKERVTTVFMHLIKTGLEQAFLLDWVAVNGKPGLMVKSNEGIHSVHAFELENNKLARAYIMRNPTKLQQAGALEG